MSTRSSDLGWGLAVADEQPRPDTTVEALATLRTRSGRMDALRQATQRA